MTHQSTMEFLGYVVRLQDGSMNPVAVEADRILCAKYPHGGAGQDVFTGVRIVEAWTQAKANIAAQKEVV